MNEEKEYFKIKHDTAQATAAAIIGRVIGYGLAIGAVCAFAVQKPFLSLGLLALGAFLMAAGGAAANMIDQAYIRKNMK